MTYRYTDPDGDELIIKPTSRYGRAAVSLCTQRADNGESAAVHVYVDQVEELIAGIRAAVHVPLDHVEELIAGIRDTARQAATERADG